MGSGLDKEQAMECRGGGPAKEGNGLRDSCTEGRGRGTGSHEGILKAGRGANRPKGRCKGEGGGEAKCPRGSYKRGRGGVGQRRTPRKSEPESEVNALNTNKQEAKSLQSGWNRRSARRIITKRDTTLAATAKQLGAGHIRGRAKAGKISRTG